MINKLGDILSEKKMKDLFATSKINELLHKKDPIEEKKHTLVFILAIIGAVAAVAAIAYAVYRFVAPDYLEDFDDIDDFDNFEDEEAKSESGE